MPKKKKMMLIDGNSLLHRAFYAIPLLSNSTGIYTNAVFGFLNMLFKVIDDEKPEYIAVAFDTKAPTFRHVEYVEYKAGRMKMPHELVGQLPLLKEVLSVLNIQIFELDGYEADDIIGTLAHEGDKAGMETVIVTGDRDALQLISEGTRVILTKRGITETMKYDREAIEKEYNMTPNQLIDLKGLMGDKSDNIPGVPGVGQKTALKLMDEFHSLENVLANIDNISGNKLKENLLCFSDQAVLSKKLVTIKIDVPLDTDLEKCCKFRQYDKEKAFEVFSRLEFRSLMGRIKFGDDVNEQIVESKEQYTRDNLKTIIIDEINQLNKIVEDIHKKGWFSIHIAQNISLCYEDDSVIIINTTHNLIDKSIPFDESIKALRPILEDEKINIYGHDLKRLVVDINRYKIKVKGLAFDTMIACYLLEPGRNNYALDEMGLKYLHYINKNADALDILRLKAQLDKRLIQRNLDELFYGMEMPLLEVLACMEIEGFKLDTETLKELGSKMDVTIQLLTHEIYNLAGEEFNLNSPKQLAVILFEKLGLPIVKKIKTGYSTDIEVLEKLSLEHDIADKLIDYRQLVKLKSTYIDGLLNLVDRKTDRIRTSFNQTVTSTGRISSTEPNLQNIPIKMEMGRQIRKAFIPSNDDFVIMTADYSQIELRVLAHISGDEHLIDAFVKNQDIHTRTASQVFNVPMEQVTNEMRNSAKAVNFGIVYGISDFGLARNLKISRKAAKTYIENYLNEYPGVKRYMSDIIETGRQQGFVTTMFNRARYLPELKSNNFNIRSFGERIAMNTPIQGTAADIIKKAMTEVHSKLIQEKLCSHILLQVHDELVLEVRKDELEEVSEIVRKEMESVVDLRVPLVVDIDSGDNWYNAK